MQQVTVFDPRSLRQLPWRVYGPILAVALLGTGFTWAIYEQVTDLERQRVHTAFFDAARDRILVVQREIHHSLNVVQDIGSFVDASDRLNRRQFRKFVEPVLKRDPSIQSLAWVPRVTEEERPRFVADARGSFHRFRIIDLDARSNPLPAPPRREHFPLLYVQPYNPGLTQLGYDLASAPKELAVLERAADSGRVQVVGRRSRLPGSTSDTEFAVYLPVYRRPPIREDTDEEDAPVITPTPQRKRLRGFAIGRFSISGTVNRSLSNLSPSGIDLTFDSVDANGRPQLLHYHGSRLRRDSRFAVEGGAGNGVSWRHTGTIKLAGSRWTVTCASIPGRYQPETWSGRMVVIGGVAFTLLFVFYLSTLVGRAEQVRKLVFQRTLELEIANDALNQEIADRVSAERALQGLNATLEHRVARRAAEAERRATELEQFAYVASHDLKAPLRGIANLASWLEEDMADKLTQETREQFNLLRDRVARMHDLIEGLLTYSRIGRAPESMERVDSGSLVAEILDSLAPPPGFEVQVAPGMPALFTDRLQLGQVFANLIGNAIKHHHRKQGHIRISGKDLGEWCEFTVADDGPGIPENYQRKVFMMFQTLKVKDFGSETGIGLALVKKIVEEHGGSIRLISKHGEGSIFRFTWNKQKDDG